MTVADIDKIEAVVLAQVDQIPETPVVEDIQAQLANRLVRLTFDLAKTNIRLAMNQLRTQAGVDDLESRLGEFAVANTTPNPATPGAPEIQFGFTVPKF